MSEELSGLDKARCEFASQSVFERRKTQYTFFLFYLTVTGACAGVVIGADDHKRILPILIVPILLQLPVFGAWWYQRKAVHQFDRIRRSILRLERAPEARHQPPGTILSTDIVFLAVPLTVVWLAYILLEPQEMGELWQNNDFRILSVAAVATTAASLALHLYYCSFREGTPEDPPKTRPVVSVESSQRLQHTIRFADEATPTCKAKPDGVMGAEIWVKVGNPPPTGPNELSFLSVDTRTPYVVDYPDEDGGKTAYYMLRWVATTCEKGPWSETASATIGA